jgi:hypothetical protein
LSSHADSKSISWDALNPEISEQLHRPVFELEIGDAVVYEEELIFELGRPRATASSVGFRQVLPMGTCRSS